MKKLNIQTLKKAIPAILLGITTIAVNAQKLPNVQKDGVRAPADIKVDGKATEWNNQFQAYNHATDVFYTIANDDNNLYLTIQATDPAIIRKILNGGITFTINTADKKNDQEGASITYPIFEKNNRMTVIFRNKPEIIPGSEISIKKADSFMYANNKRMTDLTKLIKTSGIKAMDTLISVYNEDGIKASALFDNKMNYTYELAISLKNMEMAVSNPVKFAYNVRINAVESKGITVEKSDSGEPTKIRISAGAQAGQDATDFWGEYTLAKNN